MEPNRINRILYVSFLLISVYYVLTSNFMEASCSLGIGLAFDPFDQKITWKERPRWQKIWLFVHLALAAAFFGYAIGFSDK